MRQKQYPMRLMDNFRHSTINSSRTNIKKPMLKHILVKPTKKWQNKDLKSSSKDIIFKGVIVIIAGDISSVSTDTIFNSGRIKLSTQNCIKIHSKIPIKIHSKIRELSKNISRLTKSEIL